MEVVWILVEIWRMDSFQDEATGQVQEVHRVDIFQEALSVIAHWNQEEQHYRMGWIEVTFSGQGSHKER